MKLSHSLQFWSSFFVLKHLHATTHPQSGSGSYQQLEEPEAGFVVARLEGVDEEKQEEAVECQRTSLNWDL